MPRVRRDARPNFSKLVWMARRRGPKGRAALQVLQDALMETYPKQWARAVQAAERREGTEKPYVVFWVNLERAVHQGKSSGPMEPFTLRHRAGDSGLYGAGGPFGIGVAVYRPNENFNIQRIRRIPRRPPPGPRRFGQERTRKDILARIRWDRWAAANARGRNPGQMGEIIASGHEQSLAAYQWLLAKKRSKRSRT